ncbi:C3 and PZP-like alpha-2-macroglobulin domain-containing protein 8 [Haliotis asinina]|uniref:C3 and PZP-like alpha-2-macroglobulin domain-containing protein 8 n=1 Tax=Haliotis asinina TaxID=109174 RepID=UPI003532192F
MIVPVILCFTVSFICPVQLVCFNEASITEDDRYLENSLFGIIKEKVSAARECAVACYAHLGCSSFGFEPTLRTCHLHKKDSSTAPADLVTKAPWQHSDISQWPKELSGPCEDHTCLSGTRCNVHRVTKAPLCLEADVYQPDVCSDELIPKATCSSESKVAGSVRSCTCPTNYRDVPLDVVRINQTCMVNGSWTQPLINCTGPYVRLTTPSTSIYTFQLIPTSSLQTITGGTSTVVFLVKTCHDAIFVLHTYPNSYTPVIEVAIGGDNNMRSFVHGCIGCAFTEYHDESSILSCNEYRPFWLSWRDGVISVGKGLVAGGQRFLQWTPTTNIVINYVSISTYVNNPGTWLFLEQ